MEVPLPDGIYEGVIDGVRINIDRNGRHFMKTMYALGEDEEGNPLTAHSFHTFDLPDDRAEFLTEHLSILGVEDHRPMAVRRVVEDLIGLAVRIKVHSSPNGRQNVYLQEVLDQGGTDERLQS